MSQQSLVPLKASSNPEVGSMRLQRKCACEATGETCSRCASDKQPLQRKATSGTNLDSVPPIVNDVLDSPGQMLDASTRGFMEERFGHDFSGVRVHTDARAAESSLAVESLAYTVGTNVAFGADQYAPHTDRGRRLLAHELTHVVQQSQGTSDGEHASAETEADVAAHRIASGLPATVQVKTGPTLHRLEPTEEELKKQRERTAAQCVGDRCHRPAPPPKDWRTSGAADDAAVRAWIATTSPAAAPPTNAHTRPAKTDPMKFAEPTAEELAQLRQTAKDAPPRETDQKSVQLKAEQDRLQAAKERAEALGIKNQWQKDFELSQRTPPIGLSFLGPAYGQAYYRNPSRQIQHPLLKQQADLSTSAVAGHGALGTTALAIATGTVAAATVLALGAITLPVVVSIVAEAAAGSAILTPIVTAVISNPMAVEQIASFGLGMVLSIAAAGGIKNYLEQISTPEGALHVAFDVLVLHATIQSTSGGPPRQVTFKGKVEKATPKGISARLTELPDVSDHPVLQGSSPGNDVLPKNVIPLRQPQLHEAPQVAAAAGQDFTPTHPIGTDVTKTSAVRRSPPLAPPAGQWTQPGYSAGRPNTRATTIAPRSKPQSDFERGTRKPNARVVIEGPKTTSDALEELVRVSETDEKVTTQKKGPKPITPRQAEATAGKEFESSKIKEFATRNPGYEIVPNSNFPAWLRKLFPRWSSAVAAGPDAVAINASKGTIKVFDSTGSRNEPHLAKTSSYVEQIRANLPDTYKGYTVEGEESYWQHGEKDTKGL